MKRSSPVWRGARSPKSSQLCEKENLTIFSLLRAGTSSKLPSDQSISVYLFVTLLPMTLHGNAAWSVPDGLFFVLGEEK